MIFRTRKNTAIITREKIRISRITNSTIKRIPPFCRRSGNYPGGHLAIDCYFSFLFRLLKTAAPAAPAEESPSKDSQSAILDVSPVFGTSVTGSFATVTVISCSCSTISNSCSEVSPRYPGIDSASCQKWTPNFNPSNCAIPSRPVFPSAMTFSSAS